MKLYIARHGETFANIKGIIIKGIIQGWLPGKLTKQGTEQAKKLAKRLIKEKIDVIYCSDLKRCRQTIEPFLKLNKNTPIKYVKELRERKMGIFEGKNYEIGKKWREENKLSFEDKVPGGESFSDLQKRMIKFFDKIFKKHEGKNILFMTHGTAKRSLITHLLNKQHQKRHKKFRSSNTALSIIKINDDGKHKARLINSVKHLEEK